MSPACATGEIYERGRHRHRRDQGARGGRADAGSMVMAVVDFFLEDTHVVISPLNLVILGCATFGLFAGVVTLICLLLRGR